MVTWEDDGRQITEMVRSIKYDLKRKQMLFPDRIYMQYESRRVKDESSVLQFSLKHSQMLLYLITILLKVQNKTPTLDFCFESVSSL